MTDYTDTEVFNEVARVIRGRLSIIREGGLVDTEYLYNQLKEITTLTFLLNQDSIFYLAKLASNKLRNLVRQEVKLIEDMLVSLEFLPKIGINIKSTTELSNAYTSLLSVETAGSVTNRPELKIFNKNMDRFLTEVRGNVVTYTGDLIRPREEAREILRTNLSRLKTVHGNMLAVLRNVKDLLSNYKTLDIPTKAATTIFENIRDVLSQLKSDIDDADASKNIARSRIIALKGLTSKAMVNLVLSFKDPEELKYRSPINPIPVGAVYHGRVTGPGMPAAVLTAPGPWLLPMDNLVFSVNGGLDRTVPISSIVGTTLSGRNSENFDVTAARRNVHIIVDPEVHELTYVSLYQANVYIVRSSVKLGFKHLGSAIRFNDSALSGSDQQARVVDRVVVGPIVGAYTWDPVEHKITVATPDSFQLAAVGMGLYIPTVPDTFEIVKYISGTEVIVDPRDETISSGVATLQVYGCFAGDTCYLEVSPNLVGTPAVDSLMFLGPSIKSGQLDIGSLTAADAVADLKDPTKTVADVLAPLASLYYHIEAGEAEDKIRLRLRNKLTPQMIITSTFPKVIVTGGPASVVLEEASAHELLGFLEGETDSDILLTPSELTNEVAALASDAAVTVVRAELTKGTLNTVVDTNNVMDSTKNFIELGVPVGSQLEIFDGAAAGIYRVELVASNTLTLRGDLFESSEGALSYTLTTERVQIASGEDGPGSSIEIVSAPTAFGLAAGTTYGSIATFEAIDKLGNKLDFSAAVPGDTLKVTGQLPILVDEAVGTQLKLEEGLPSNVEGAPFQVSGQSSDSYAGMTSSLETILTSPEFLASNKLDESVDAIDIALTAAVTPGHKFASDLSRAKLVLADLLSTLTGSPNRVDEYNTVIPTKSISLVTTLEQYSVVPVPEVDSLLDAFRERKCDRVVKLLTTGDLVEFYDTDAETASFAGKLLSASRATNQDLPSTSRSEHAADLSYDLPYSEEDVPDPLSDFSDATPDTENYE